MKRILLKVSSALALLSASFSASAVLAAEGISEGGSAQWAKIGAAIAIGLGAFGAASAQGRAAASALEGIARNPASRPDVFVPLILSLVFMEFQALLCFVIALQLAG